MSFAFIFLDSNCFDVKLEFPNALIVFELLDTRLVELVVAVAAVAVEAVVSALGEVVFDKEPCEVCIASLSSISFIYSLTETTLLLVDLLTPVVLLDILGVLEFITVLAVVGFVLDCVPSFGVIIFLDKKLLAILAVLDTISVSPDTLLPIVPKKFVIPDVALVITLCLSLGDPSSSSPSPSPGGAAAIA